MPRCPQRPHATPLAALLLAVGLAALAVPAAAQIPLGAVGPDFTKVPLGGGSVSLSQYSGKVVVLFLLGYS
jgi:hypothetical protein